MPPAWSTIRMRSMPGLAQLGAGENTGDAAADDHHVDVVGDRLALGVRG